MRSITVRLMEIQISSATALFERPPFRVGVTHGIVLGDDGQKMSKSLRNYPDVSRVFDSYGSDAMRWFLLSSSLLRGGDLSVTEQGIRDAVRDVLRAQAADHPPLAFPSASPTEPLAAPPWTEAAITPSR